MLSIFPDFDEGDHDLLVMLVIVSSGTQPNLQLDRSGTLSLILDALNFHNRAYTLIIPEPGVVPNLVRSEFARIA